MEHEYELTVNVRPVYPLAIRSGEFFSQVNPLWVGYLVRDTMRVAEMLGLAYRWPQPDPVVVDMQTLAAASNQPYIHWLTRLGCAAAEVGHGLRFLRQVSHTIWSGEIDAWHEGDHLARAAHRAGVDLAALDAKVVRDPDRYEAIIQENQRAHQAAGHWGVPTMVFEGEPFFGQDRLDVLLWRMKQRGLKRRADRT